MMHKSRKLFPVSGSAGGKIQAEQLATFAHYIKSVQFRFVVTKIPGMNVAAVTHRASGNRVCEVPSITVQAALGDYQAAGRSALTKFIAGRDEQRVYDVLRAAEARSTPQNSD